MPKLDDVNWHLNGGEFPPDLPEDNAATHIGIFVAWAIHRGLWGAPRNASEAIAIEAVRSRAITGRVFLMEQCDGKLFSGMLHEQGRIFAQKYYPRAYDKDYFRTLTQDLESDYLVADSWENYESVAKVLEQRFAEHNSKPWWKFW